MAERLERWSLVAIAVGVALRLASPLVMDLGYDASTYAATGHGFARTGELVLAWGDVLTFNPQGEGHSHHFPPSYPLYLGVVFLLFGFGLAQAKLAAVAMGLAALVVAFAATRDLYGKRAALVVTALLALDPHLLWITGMGFSENLALVFFTLTMWAILKSLDKERFIVLAGLFAALAYLTRSSMGAFFLLAGVGGAAWRFAHRGWRGLARPWYALAIVVFGSLVALWAWRNVALFGWPNWETSPGTRGIPRYIGDHLGLYGGAVPFRFALMLSVLAPFLVLMWPEAGRSLRRIRDEHTSALWLSIALTLVLSVFFSAAYLAMGNNSRFEVLRLDNARYALIALVPLAWALVRERGPKGQGPGARGQGDARVLGLFGVLLVGSLAVFAYPANYLPAQAGRALDPWLEEGDDVAIAGSGKYAFYAYLTRPTDISVYVQNYDSQRAPEFIVALYDFETPGYVKLGEKTMHHPLWPAGDERVVVLGREDVVRERGVVLAPMRGGW